MKKLKICYLGDWQSIHIQRWINYFVNRGHIVHLISRSPKSCRQLKGVSLHDLLLPPYGENLKNKKGVYKLYLFLRDFKLRKIISKIKPDILHAHYVTYYGWWAARSNFHPFVLTAWGGDIYRDTKGPQIKEIIFALKRADLITSDSEDLQKATIKLKGSSRNNYVVQFGIDLSIFNLKPDTSGLRERLGIAKNQLIVLSTRSFKPWYNIDTIIESIPYVVKKIPQVKFILKNCYGYEEEKIKNLVKKIGVDKNALIVGEVSYEEMANFYKIADVFVSIPSFDSTPVSLLEAMACGAIPIVSDLPAVREWVQNNVNGFIVPVRNSIALAKAIIKALKNKELRKDIALNNFEIIQKRANYVKQMEYMEGLYYSLLRIK